MESRLLIDINDGEFKQHLDHYKYADRFPEQPMGFYRDQAEEFLSRLELLLNENTFLYSDKPSLADMAIFPFIRQFVFVDKEWFDQTQYTKLQAWLENLLNEPLFLSIMQKYHPWKPGNIPLQF